MSYDQGGFPQAPQPPEGWAPPQRGERPASVENAVRLMFVTALFSLIGVIVTLATKDDLRKRLLAANPGSDQAHLDNLVNGAITIAIVVSVVLLALYVALAFQVRKGKNWARIVTWVFAGLGVLGALLSFAGTATTLSRLLSIIQGVIDVAIIVLLAKTESNRYFKPTYR
ncbi:MAG TPA: hypothetical protein VHS54_10430 [Jatrophihabitans sp.]|jgi:hypothetical protein|nr:hypothetical protein [Jatrophihabitans sp.]